MKILRDRDISTDSIKKNLIVIVGYGSQGRAQALNLHDNGYKIAIGLRPGSKTIKKVKDDGLQFMPILEAIKKADILVMLLPDETQPSLYSEIIKPNLKKGGTLLFAHGANIFFKTIIPRSDLDVIMVAPKSPGPLLRQRFVEGSGVPAIFSVHQDSTGNAKRTALEYGKAIGCARSGLIEASFEQEAKTDLFGEQTVLCGGLIELIKAAYEELVKRGLPPELAYYECCHEVKFIADLLHTKGFATFAKSISTTALYGGLKQGPRIIDSKVRAVLSEIYDEIDNGKFAKEWFNSNGSKNDWLNKKREELINHSIEKAGEKVRAL